MSSTKLCEPVELDTTALFIHTVHMLTFRVQPCPGEKLKYPNASVVSNTHIIQESLTVSRGMTAFSLGTLQEEQHIVHLHGRCKFLHLETVVKYQSCCTIS